MRTHLTRSVDPAQKLRVTISDKNFPIDLFSHILVQEHIGWPRIFRTSLILVDRFLEIGQIRHWLMRCNRNSNLHIQLHYILSDIEAPGPLY